MMIINSDTINRLIQIFDDDGMVIDTIRNTIMEFEEYHYAIYKMEHFIRFRDKNMDAEEYSNHISTTINHFYEKLFNLKDLMNTDSAKDIAQAREMYMKDYISEFMDEWKGIR